MPKVYLNQLSAVQYLIDRSDLGGARESVEDSVYYSISKAYQDVMDGHYEHAAQRLREAADAIEYIEKKISIDKSVNWLTSRKDF